MNITHAYIGNRGLPTRNPYNWERYEIDVIKINKIALIIKMGSSEKL